jgi:branched-chain amino acid transport system permease protein
VKRPRWIGALVLFVLACLALPFVASGYWVRVFTSVFMMAALAQSVNFMAGFAGYADFGNVLYFGVGAYTTGFLMTKNLPFPLAALGGAVLAAAIAAGLGLPILRLRGHYFAIATIGTMEGSRELVVNMGFLGGGSGLNVPIVRMPPQQFSLLIYVLMLGLMLGYCAMAYTLSRSSLGYGLRAIKADEQAAAVMGIDTTRFKVLAWMMSAACSSLVGAIYAVWTGFLEPGTAFDIVRSTEYFIMMLLGGPGTVLGPIVGAFILQLLEVLVWGQLLRGHAAVVGVVIVVVVLFLPNGLMNALRAWQLRRGAGGWASIIRAKTGQPEVVAERDTSPMAGS